MRRWLTIGEQYLDGQASGVRLQSGLTSYSGGSNVCKDTDAKAKTQEINDEPVAGLSGVGDIGGHAQPYGRSMCRLGHGSARASSREAFLTVESD
jgi:hypothetical protein